MYTYIHFGYGEFRQLQIGPFLHNSAIFPSYQRSSTSFVIISKLSNSKCLLTSLGESKHRSPSSFIPGPSWFRPIRVDLRTGVT